MSIQQQIEEIELSMDVAKEKIELSRKLGMLEEHSAFKEIILDGYLNKEAARLAAISVESSLLNAEDQKMIDIRLRAIGLLRQYFMNIHRTAINAEKAMQDYLEELAHARSEESQEENDSVIEYNN